MMQPLRIGLVAVARPTFDMALAQQVAQAARDALSRDESRDGFELLGDGRLVSDAEAVASEANALQAAAPDAVVLLQATFADSTLAVRLAEAVDAPLLLWAVPEARTGGRLRLNSLCGINLAGHALTLRGHRYAWTYAPPDDAAARDQLRSLALAGRVRRLLRQTRLGVIGDPPAGFDSCRLDEARLHQQLGVRVVRCDLATIFDRARRTPQECVRESRARLEAQLPNLAELDRTAVNGTLAVHDALRQVASETACQALAVRCWPEFFTELGCAACGAMALLNTEMLPCGCEADANGVLTQLILQWLSGEPAFGTDLVECDAHTDSAVVWHCGQAPLTMADPAHPPRGDVHSNRKVPLVMAFALKPGRVTVARLSQATGTLRMVIGRGEMLSAPPSFSGTSGVIRFDRPAPEVIATLMNEGLEHHLALAYGDHTAALKALARLLDLPVLQL